MLAVLSVEKPLHSTCAYAVDVPNAYGYELVDQFQSHSNVGFVPTPSRSLEDLLEMLAQANPPLIPFYIYEVDYNHGDIGYKILDFLGIWKNGTFYNTEMEFKSISLIMCMWE